MITSSTRPACIENAFATRYTVLSDAPTRSATTRRSGAGPAASSKASNTRARMITRARVLLALDEAAGPAPDRRVVAERVGASERTVYLVAKAFSMHAGRVEEVIIRKKRTTPPVEPKE